LLSPIHPREARFEVLRVEAPADIPPVSVRVFDVALLDMNHGYANVGHDAIVALVRDASLALDDELARTDARVRVLSYAVRDKLMVPDHTSGRHRLYLGTGGPGHLDPRRNTAEHGAQEILEDPSWELPLWRLFEAIAADDDAALFGVCHTFGLLCRWSGVAEAVLRGPAKGGAMSGVGTNVLTPQAIEHPWFAPLAHAPGHAKVPVLDSRYYDLIPSSQQFPGGTTPIAFEASHQHDGPGEALTMLEIARESDGSAPRIFGVNSHPEIGSSERVREILERLLASGQITPEVYAQRSTLLPILHDVHRDQRLHVGRRVFSDLVARRLSRLAHAA